MKAARTPDHSLWQNFLLLAARVLMGWIFVEAGWRKLLAMDSFIASLTTRRVPYAGSGRCPNSSAGSRSCSARGRAAPRSR